MFLEESKKRVIETLYDCGAVKVDLVNKFQLKGGFLSPVFIDATVLQKADTRGFVSSALLILVHEDFRKTRNHLNIDAVVGVASGGVCWASILANCDLLDLLTGHAYAKDHGLLNQIDGDFSCDNPKAIVIDNIITSGTSVLSVVEALRNGNKKAEVAGVYTLIDWCFPSVNANFKEAGVEKKCLISVKEILDYGFEHRRLPQDAEEQIRAFSKEIEAQVSIHCKL